MHESAVLARWLLIGGGVLAILGLILWFALPVSMPFPPYLLTALLALGYGAYCLKFPRPGSGSQP